MHQAEHERVLLMASRLAFAAEVPGANILPTYPGVVVNEHHPPSRPNLRLPSVRQDLSSAAWYPVSWRSTSLARRLIVSVALE